jgi:hypothetical protein
VTPDPTEPAVDHGPVVAGPRSIRNPDSLNELSVQERSIWLADTASAPIGPGAVGRVCGVVAFAVFE